MKEGVINGEEEQKYLSINKVSNRSELVQEVLTEKHGFIETKALYIFLTILLILIGFTWFIKYPDIIETKALLTSENAPKEIIPKIDGRLIKLFVLNNQYVVKDEVIGWLESTADHKEVSELSTQIEKNFSLLKSGKSQNLARGFAKRYHNLGELQSSYQQFMVAWQLYNDYVLNGFYSKKKILFEQDSHSLDSSKQTIQNQRKLTLQDIKLAKESFDMNKILMERKVISDEEFRIQKSKFLNKQIAIPQLEASLLSNETQKNDKIKEIDQLNHDIRQQEITFQLALQSLKSQVDDWIKKYVLQSPVNGKVSFIIPVQENQYLRAGKLVGYVNPINNYIYAETTLPQNNFGKVDTGLQVQLRFDAYPYQENGFVLGKLNYISNIPSDSGFLARIKLDHGLSTNNHISIPYKNGLKAQAIIITKDMRLFERFYYGLIKSASPGSK